MFQFFVKLALGHARKHRLEAALCLLGIVLGVAVVISIETAVQACVGSFRGAVDSMAERSTHSIVARQGKISDQAYIDLRRRRVAASMAPMIDRGILIEPAGGQSATNSAAADPDRSIVARLIGVDAFSEKSLRSFTQMQSSLDKEAFRQFITEPNKIVLVDALARQVGCKVGDNVDLIVGGKRIAAHVLGIVTPTGVARAQLSDLIIADLSTAQELTNSIDSIDRIDLSLAGDGEAKRIEAALPPQLKLISTRQRSDSLADLIASYKLNLNALSLLASFVAVFIVYNSLLVSVQQRAASLGILRCLGASRLQLAGVYLLEAVTLGLLGGAIGVIAGWGISRLLVGAVAQTINDIYAAVRPAPPVLDAASWLKGMSLSMASGLAGALVPIWQASHTPPMRAFQKTARSRQSHAFARWLSIVAAGLALLAWVVYKLPGESPIAGFVMALLIALAFAFICPLLTAMVCNLLEHIARRTQSLSIQMAATGISKSLGITGVAVAAMMLAMAMNVGIRTMVRSFRGSLATWVGERFAADLFVGPELLVNHRIEATLEPGAVDWVRRQANIKRIVTYRITTIELGGKTTGLSGTDVNELLAAGSLPLKGKLLDASFDPKRDCLISEPLSGRLHLGAGQSLTLRTPSGSRELHIAGVYFDFGAQRGQVMLDRSTYAELFHDDTITSMHVTLVPGSDRRKIAAAWMRALRDEYPVIVSSFGEVQTEIMTVFDRTFLVTSVLSLLAGGVAFCGLAGSLLAVALARRRDYSILTAIGMSGRQTLLWVVAQGLLLAWTSAFVASIGGTVLAFVLSGVIQYRSFGWSIPTEPQPRYWAETFILATVAALVATIYPVVRLRSIPPAGNLREE